MAPAILLSVAIGGGCRLGDRDRTLKPNKVASLVTRINNQW